MPSLQQINKDKPLLSDKKHRKSKIKSFLKAILAVMAVAGWLYYRDMPKIIAISDDAWSTRENGIFKELFDSPVKKIVWFGANCPLSAQKKNILDTALQYQNMNAHYEHHPYLQASLRVSCEKKDCLDLLVMNNCSDGFCIIIPNARKIIYTKRENLFRDLEKFKNY